MSGMRSSLSIQLNINLYSAVFSLIFGPDIIFPSREDDPRWALTRVCSTWRNFILSSHHFWDHYVFRPEAVVNKRLAHNRLKLYTNWAGNRPLSFIFHFCVDRIPAPTSVHQNPQEQGDTGGDVYRDNAANVVPDLPTTFIQQYGLDDFSIVESIILPYIRRLKNLRCAIKDDDLVRFLLNIPSGQLRVLERIHVTLHGAPSSDHPRINDGSYMDIRVFMNLPHLRQVLLDIRNGINPKSFRFSNGMTCLKIQGTSVDSEVFISVMKDLCGSLEIGRFNIKLGPKCMTSPASEGDTPFYMVNLKDLQLKLIGISDRWLFLKKLGLPVLEELIVSRKDQKGKYLWDIPSITAMLSRSTISLRRLTLHNGESYISATGSQKLRCKTSYTALETLFLVIGNLHHLCLPLGIDVDIHTLKKISTGRLLPQLESLDMGTYDGIQVVDMVRERNRADSISTRVLPSQINSLRVTVLTDPAETRQDVLDHQEKYILEEIRALGLASYGLEFLDGCKACIEG